MIQDAVRLPLIIAGVFNVSTSKLIESNYPLRAGLNILAPTKPTCKIRSPSPSSTSLSPRSVSTRTSRGPRFSTGTP
eukprot:7364005-Pyramimonas_sp.AAC.2